MAETFAEMNVTEALAKAVEAAGFSKPTELQKRLIPALHGGSDLLVRAFAGSGRSLGYLLPMMQRLIEREPLEGRGPRSLILSPSRDAAMKIGRTIKELGRESPLRFGTVVGGRPYPMQHQLLRRPLDILVATPSRLMDHIRRGRVPFERLEMLVIDRVDEMLEMGLGDDLAFIAASSPGGRQTVLLAERIDSMLEGLSERLQHMPERIELAEADAAAMLPEATLGGETFAADVREASGTSATPAPHRRARNAPRAGQARKPRTSKSSAALRGKANGNVAPGTAAKAKAKTKGKQQETKGRQGRATGNRAGLRGPGRRTGGPNRRQPEVRFPSDYANGPHAPQSRADAVEQHREVKRHEPMQYLADYGFSAGSRTRKPVTVVYRGKGRKATRREGEGDDEGV